MISKAKTPASITAAGASAIVFTGGKAEADSIIVSNVLNVTLGIGNSPPSVALLTPSPRTGSTPFLAAPISEGLPKATRPTAAGRCSAQFTCMNGYPSWFTLDTLFAHYPVAAGITSAGGSLDKRAAIGERAWGAVSTAAGTYTDEYYLFKFRPKSATPYEYGWIETSLSVTEADQSAGSYGPTVTIVQYAFDDTGAFIAAGETAPTPEPSSLAESVLAALTLGRRAAALAEDSPQA